MARERGGFGPAVRLHPDGTDQLGVGGTIPHRLALDFVALTNPTLAIQDEATKATIRRVGSICIAIAITIYFFRKNLVGIHESSGKALRIMWFTTAVAAIVLVWCAATLFVRGPANRLPTRPDLSPKIEFQVVRAPDRVTGEVREMWLRDANGNLVPKLDEHGKPVPKLDSITGRQVDPLGFLPHVAPGLAEGVREGGRETGLAGTDRVYWPHHGVRALGARHEW